MKKAVTKKIKKKSVTQLKKEADRIFSIWIRKRDADEDGFVTCFTCSRKIHWKQSQNMHFIPRGCLALRYHEKNCFAGCVNCNVWLKGNYIEYTLRMQEKFGVEFVNWLNQQKWVTTKDFDYQAIIDYYKDVDN